MKKLARDEIAALGLTLGGLGLMFVLTENVGNLWYRLSWFYVAMIPAALLLVRLEWKKLFKFEQKHALWGVAAAAILYAAGWVGGLLLREIWPGAADEIERMYAVLADLPGWQVWPLLLFIIAGEELVWRQAATQPFVQRMKDGAAVVGGVLFMLVHKPWAPPTLCLASLFFGAAWSWMAVRTKSYWPPFIAHIGWDVLVMFVARYE